MAKARVGFVSGLIAIALLSQIDGHSESTRQEPETLSPVEVFALYKAGNFERVERALRHISTLERLTSSQVTVDSKHTPEIQAALYLEATAAACEHEFHTTIAFGGYSEPDSAAPLVTRRIHVATLFERALTALTQAHDGGFRAAWQQAAIALAEGVNETGARAVETGFGAHMLRKIVDDKGVDQGTRLLGEAFVQESIVWNLLSYQVPAADAPLAPTPLGQRYRTLVRGQLDKARATAITKLTAARAYQDTTEEATLRLAVLLTLRNRSGDATRAVGLLQGLKRASDDSRIQYLAALFLGRGMEEQRHFEEAETLYREAAAIKPSAQSARLALAALLYTRGSGPAGSELINGVLSVAANADDPWALYQYGEYRLWPARLKAMRAALR